ncbi:MAG: AAA family ATPase [Prevotellaceae bacterium]|jgi:5-methylcytosine-specific restriction protein B|nr:AAA family ATPase [Prevotellaceae bacterium]
MKTKRTIIKEDGTYDCNIDITVEEWKKILQDEELSFYKEVLIRYYNEPKHSSTCKAMGVKYNASPHSFNSLITHFARKVQKKLNRFEVRTGGEPTYWVIPMTGKYVNNYFEWTLRPELVQAIEEIWITKSNIMNDYEKFKKLLEYFVTHLRYVTEIIKENDDNVVALIPSAAGNNFKKSGQGHTGDAIQNQIKDWENYSCGQICININPTNYKNRGCYLNWKGTGHNVIAVWDDDDIKQLQLTTYDYEETGDWDKSGKPLNLSDLGLFDGEAPNTNLKYFFDNFCKLYKPQLFIMNKFINLLNSKKNLILTGAPGVGKTYKTAEIALSILGKDISKYADRKALINDYKQAVKDGYIAFTTFHQSLDYEEFVEGLKPNCDDGNVSYSVEAGIFKQMCKSAIEKGSTDSLDKAIEQFKSDCSEEVKKVKNRSGYEFSVSYRGGKTFGVRSDKSEAEEGRDFPANIEAIKQLYSGNDSGIYNKTYVWGILEYLKETYQIQPYKNDASNKNYILIIDEINRGNISKIFGELITLLEKDKRLGEENEITVTLPYSQDTFGVPSNLYIIGTMNTADRSIGQIDYALRRRFAFVALQADRIVIEQNIEDQTTKDKTLALFDAIYHFISENINEDLDAEDLMIGHSYFLCKTEDDLKRRLEYEIVPLIREYAKDGIIMADKKTLNDEIKKWETL